MKKNFPETPTEHRKLVLEIMLRRLAEGDDDGAAYLHGSANQCMHERNINTTEGADPTDNIYQMVEALIEEGKVRLAETRGAIERVIDWRSCEGYEWTVRSTFLNRIERGEIASAQFVQKQFAKSEGITLEEETLMGTRSLIYRGLADWAILAREAFREIIRDKIAEHHQDAVRKGFEKCLSEARWLDAKKIRDEFAGGIDLTEEIVRGASAKLTPKNTGNALKIREIFGKEIDIRKQANYSPYMRDWFFREGDRVAWRYIVSKKIGREETKCCFENSPEITPELLFHFEAFIIFTTDHFREEIQIEEYRLRPRTSDPTELTEENQAKLQAFAANLQAELSAKIRAIASPELIAAYLAQNAGATGSEFLTNAA